uniref:Uncharacterized protein n=1 Tax=Moniliophthora roreri TaxID=221103 RepID=A0A0W0FT94_MONRR
MLYIEFLSSQISSYRY